MEARKQFTFYGSYAEAASSLPDAQRLEVYDAIVKYGLYGEEPVFTDSIAKAFFALIKPTLDSGRKMSKGGSKGNASQPKGDANPPASPPKGDSKHLPDLAHTSPEPCTNLTATLTQPCDNLNATLPEPCPNNAKVAASPTQGSRKPPVSPTQAPRNEKEGDVEGELDVEVEKEKESYNTNLTHHQDNNGTSSVTTPGIPDDEISNGILRLQFYFSKLGDAENVERLYRAALARGNTVEQINRAAQAVLDRYVAGRIKTLPTAEEWLSQNRKEGAA